MHDPLLNSQAKDFATETETLRREMETVARWRKVQDALEAERRRREALEAEVSALQAKVLGLQQQNSALQAGPGEPEGARREPAAPACEPAPGGGGSAQALACPDPGLQASEVEPSADVQVQDTRRAIEAYLAGDSSEHVRRGLACAVSACCVSVHLCIPRLVVAGVCAPEGRCRGAPCMLLCLKGTPHLDHASERHVTRCDGSRVGVLLLQR